jgi:Uma2 family endonuclease
VSVGSPLSPMMPEPAPFEPRRFTVDEYHRLGEVGVLTEDDRVELLEGVITPKMVHNPPHDAAITLLDEAIRSCLPSGWTIRIQSSMTMADSEPEPDMIVVRGKARDYARQHPVAADVGLVVEVAETSLVRDRHKARLYARAGVLVYWIVNLVDGQVEVHLQPTGPVEAPAYQETAVYGRGDSVPLTIAATVIGKLPVDDLLP